MHTDTEGIGEQTGAGAMRMETAGCGGCGQDVPAASLSVTNEGTRCVACFEAWNAPHSKTKLSDAARAGYAIMTLPVFLQFGANGLQFIPIFSGLAILVMMGIWFLRRHRSGAATEHKHEALLVIIGVLQVLYGLFPTQFR